MKTIFNQTETMRMTPRRVFKCTKENRVMGRKDVLKDHNGRYHCSSCGETVQDVTNTQTGHDFMEILAL